MKNFALTLRGALGVGVALALAVSFSQQAAAQAMLEEIVVTARKVEENIQDAPITVNAMTAAQLEDAGVTQTADYIQFIPNVTLAESQTIGTSFLTVRGLSRVRNGELPVAVVVDDVLIVNARQFIGQVFDTQQIEVAKGPQGALYGRNASNGAIIVTTKPPSEEPEGHVKLSYGTANEMGVEGSYSGPISDNAAFRLSGRVVNRDGYFHNVTRDEDVDPYEDRTLRARLSWSPSDTISVDLKGQVSRHSGKGIGFHWPGAAQFEIFGVFLGTAEELGVTVDQVVSEGANLTGLPYVANNPDRGTRDTSSFSVKIDASFDFADVKSVTTYDELQTSSVADRAPYLSYFDGTQHSFVDVDGWSQEIRFTSNSDGPLSWQFGGYYLAWERLRSTVSGIDKGQGNIRVIDVPEFEDSTNPTGVDPGSFLSFVEDSDAQAVFGSVEWAMTDQFTVNVAGRYDRENREQLVNPYNTAGRVYSRADASGVNRPYGAAACSGAPGDMPDVTCGAYATFSELLANTRPSRETNEAEFSKFQPKVTLAYAATDEINLYGSWGIGYRAGQFNYPGIGIISATANEFIEQEENSAFEVGVKGDYGNFRFNAAWFSSSVDNTQYFPFDGLAFVQVFEDIDEADLDGFELEAAWRPLENLDVYAAYGKTNTEITAYAERPGTVGNDLPYVPKDTFNAGARIEFDLGAGLTFFARADYERRGEQYWTPENTHPRDTLSLVNLRAGLEGDNWATSLYVNNAGDEEYNSEVVTPLFVHPAAPRVWRVDFRYNF
ncbi:MAG: TonB-dependent receptor [Caldilineaceae bacterium]|nr:TonB-dependent receptor [Caldilineaceae bacterium]